MSFILDVGWEIIETRQRIISSKFYLDVKYIIIPVHCFIFAFLSRNNRNVFSDYDMLYNEMYGMGKVIQFDLNSFEL